MSILCIGQTAYDITLPMQESMIENQKYRIYDKFECLGGPAANAAYLCAKWQQPTILITRLGKDTYGTKIIKDFIDVGLNCDYILYPIKFDTPLSIIINNQSNGSRTILNNPGYYEQINYKLPEDDIDVILFDGHELDISLAAIKQYPNAISILDAGTCKENTVELAKVVDYLVCSQDFANQYMKKEINFSNRDDQVKVMRELKKLNKRNVVVTLGEKGLLYEENEIKQLSAYEVKAMDTTGAGDIFHGSFAYAMHEKYTLKDALKLASMCSAISITRLGGQSAIPDFQEVMDALEKGEYK